jgi:hypothetical protein
LSQDSPTDLFLRKGPESGADENHDARSVPTTRGFLTGYIIISLAYGFLAHQFLVLMERPVGSICPSYNRADLLVPAGQICMLVLDAVVVVQVARWRRAGDDPNMGCNLAWASLAFLSLLSAFAIAGVAIVYASGLFIKSPTNMFHWAPAVQKLILRDMVVDSAVAASMLVSAVGLLGSMHSASVAAVTVSASILFHYLKEVREERDLVMLPGRARWGCGLVGIGTIVLLFFLVCSDGGLRQTPNLGVRKWTARPWFAFCYFGLTAVLLLSLYAQRSMTGPAALSDMIDRARASSQAWIRKAAQSQSLSEAVRLYQVRYGMLPPPNFDKWYMFATAHNSAIIDTFDQIHDDLLPFWGIPPAVLRTRTTHLVEQTHAGIGGFSIRNHTIYLSPLTPGSHFWMMEGYRGMVEPFVEWLPDMDLAFNIDDECRVVVLFNDIQELTGKGRQAQARVPVTGAKASFSEILEPSWTARHLEEGFKEAHSEDPLTPFISFRHEVYSIFDDFIAPTCAPSSPALSQRWWSRKECLPSGRGVVQDIAASMDLCQRPDIARMHGFLLDPAILGVSRTLLPIFSQSRVSGYRDILVPSPWNFLGKTKVDVMADRPWFAKMNSIFWRGSSTDGASRTSTWTSFLRSRLVHIGQLASHRPRIPAAVDMVSGHATPSAREPIMNVSFVGEFYKGEPGDKHAQTAAFYGKEGKPPPGVDFQEHWAHRHLVDLDGAAFSGRFIPFLQSHSLPYRAALFRTWYEERIHAWQHYVPLDVSLMNLLGLVEHMEKIDGTGAVQSPPSFRERGMSESAAADVGRDDYDKLSGVTTGHRIATDGRRWAHKALRNVDMQIYMFRLLLEWARLVDDDREELGFSM